MDNQEYPTNAAQELASPQKGNIRFVVLLLLVLLISGIGTYIFLQNSIRPPITTDTNDTYQQTAISTKDWKTYTNQQLSYSIQYPPSYDVAQNQKTTCFKPKGAKFCSVSIVAYDNIDNLTLDEWVAKNPLTTVLPLSPTPIIIPFTKTTLNSYDALTATDPVAIYYVVAHKNVIQKISQSFGQYDALIVNTFTFTQ